VTLRSKSPSVGRFGSNLTISIERDGTGGTGTINSTGNEKWLPFSSSASIVTVAGESPKLGPTLTAKREILVWKSVGSGPQGRIVLSENGSLRKVVVSRAIARDESSSVMSAGALVSCKREFALEVCRVLAVERGRASALLVNSSAFKFATTRAKAGEFARRLDTFGLGGAKSLEPTFVASPSLGDELEIRTSDTGASDFS
jgi:hypothetical protein